MAIREHVPWPVSTDSSSGTEIYKETLALGRREACLHIVLTHVWFQACTGCTYIHWNMHVYTDAYIYIYIKLTHIFVGRKLLLIRVHNLKPQFTEPQGYGTFFLFQNNLPVFKIIVNKPN